MAMLMFCDICDFDPDDDIDGDGVCGDIDNNVHMQTISNRYRLMIGDGV